MSAFLRRVIVRAAPTCTLWEHRFEQDVFVFKFNAAWVITRREMEDARL
jgi:hypothetical protein